MSLRLPAEWEPQSGTLLTWPHSDQSWGEHLVEVERVFVQIVRHICDHQKVLISAHNDSCRNHVRNLLRDIDNSQHNVDLYTVPSNDSWARDHGPITVFKNERPVLLDFKFNGWNHKYDYRLDNAITTSLYKKKAFHTSARKCIDTVLEGGAIETNGKGCLVTTSTCLLDNNRNPGTSREDYEALFYECFGCKQTIWLSHGPLSGDDTDGHIDTLVRFVDATTLVYQHCEDIKHEDYHVLQKLEKELVTIRSETGESFTLIPLPTPKKPYSTDGSPLPATYVNFIITNNKVLIPSYGDANDEIARRIVADCFPGREVVSINAMPLIRQYGSLHCTAMQLPTGVIE